MTLVDDRIIGESGLELARLLVDSADGEGFELDADLGLDTDPYIEMDLPLELEE